MRGGIEGVAARLVCLITLIWFHRLLKLDCQFGSGEDQYWIGRVKRPWQLGYSGDDDWSVAVMVGGGQHYGCSDEVELLLVFEWVSGFLVMKPLFGALACVELVGRLEVALRGWLAMDCRCGGALMGFS